MHCPWAYEFINSPVVTSTLCSSGGSGVKLTSDLASPLCAHYITRCFPSRWWICFCAGQRRVMRETSLWGCWAFSTKLKRSVKRPRERVYGPVNIEQWSRRTVGRTFMVRRDFCVLCWPQWFSLFTTFLFALISVSKVPYDGKWKYNLNISNQSKDNCLISRTLVHDHKVAPFESWARDLFAPEVVGSVSQTLFYGSSNAGTWGGGTRLSGSELGNYTVVRHFPPHVMHVGIFRFWNHQTRWSTGENWNPLIYIGLYERCKVCADIISEGRFCKNVMHSK